MSIIANSDVKTFLGITVTGDDALLTTLLTQIEEYVQNVYCERQFAAANHTEYYDGDGSGVLLLDNYPIVSVTSVHDDTDREYGADDLIDSDDIITYEKEGKLVLDGLCFTKGNKNVKVVYRAGYGSGEGETAMPNEIKLALIQLTAALYLEGKGSLDAMAGNSEIYRPNKLRKEAYAILDKYKRIR